MNAPQPSERVLHILTGCTAVGKTQWALRWAEAHSAEIISCDSLLFYRGMDIGTAKPARSELERVPHHLLDIREVSEPMNAALYSALALAAAEDIRARGRSVLVVGGSGFYLKTYFAAVADGNTVPPEVRSRVSDLLERDGLPALVNELRRLNPAGLAGLDAENPRRVARALERCLASGRTLADLSSEFARARPAFADWKVRLTRLDRSRPDLEAKIEARVDAMLSAGLVAEVARLSNSGLRSNPSAARAIGYRETLEVLEGRLPMAELRDAIARDTLALVKKQRTWFRTQLPPHEVLATAELKDEALLFP